MAKPAKAGDATPPTTREQLLVQHAEARARRNAAPLGSHAWEVATADVGRIEVEIARIERAMDPPRV
jgi:hypothetical protein